MLLIIHIINVGQSNQHDYQLNTYGVVAFVQQLCFQTSIGRFMNVRSMHYHEKISSEWGPVNIIIKKVCVRSDDSGNVVPDEIG